MAARDTNEYVVKRILKHDPNKKHWLVQWQLDGDEEEKWETFEVLKDVQAFHHNYVENGLSTLFPKQHVHRNSSQRQQIKRQQEPPLTTAALSDPAYTPKSGDAVQARRRYPNQ